MQAPTSIGTSQQLKQTGSTDSTPVQGGDPAHALRISHGRRADMAESESEQLALATPARTPNPAEARTPPDSASTPFSPFSAHLSTEAHVRLAARPVSPREASPLASSLPNLSATGRQRETWNEDSPYRGRASSNSSGNSSSNNNSNSSNAMAKKAPSRSPSPVKALQKTTTLRHLSTPGRPTAALGAEAQSPRPRPNESAFPLTPPKLHAQVRAETPAASNDTTQVYANTLSLLGLLTKVPALRDKAAPVAGDLQRFATLLLEDRPEPKALRNVFDRFRGALEDNVVARKLLAQIECTIGFLPELSPEKPDPRLPDLRRQLADSLAGFVAPFDQ